MKEDLQRLCTTATESSHCDMQTVQLGFLCMALTS